MKLIISISICCFCFYSNNLKAQIIYTDIPDTTLVFPVVTGAGGAAYYYDFDINNDSVDDLTFVLITSKNWDINYLEVFKWYIMRPTDSLTIMIYNVECTSALNLNDTINDSQYWSQFGLDAVLSWHDYYEYIEQLESWHCNYPNNDKYCGLKLKINGNTHYGWLGLSWGTHWVTVKDYAYNATPDMMILAGQIKLSDINEIHQPGGFNIIKYNRQLEISNEQGDQKINNIRIYNTSGQCIRDKEVNDYRTSIDISSIPTGIYIIQFITPDNIFVQKYFISNN